MEELNLLISELGNWKAVLETETLLIEGGGLVLDGVGLLPAGILLNIMGLFSGFEAAQIDWLQDYLSNALADAQLLAGFEANALGLTGEDKLAHINTYSIDIIVSNVSNEGVWYNSSVVITTSISPSRGNYLFLGAASIWKAAALSW